MTAMGTSFASCVECGMLLFSPVTQMPSSDVGLYSDARYPGRLIVSLREHYDHFDTVPLPVLNEFMRDVHTAAGALRTLPGVSRVNVAVLGNREWHVHAHVIPRYVGDPIHDRAPWDGAAPHAPLARTLVKPLITLLSDRISRSSS